MVRDMILEHLAMAERHVAEGEAHIKRQKEIIDELQEAGHDITQAAKLLATLEEVQSQHVAGVERIRVELARSEF